MAAYRFCRTDDIELLVDSLNRCWAPYAPDRPLETMASFKRSIRDLQVWCSSCMVAFAGREPVGVLIGAKRQAGTLVHRIAVHPDHCRRGHGRHLLASLGSKLAILGPPRLIAEVPATAGAALALFDACGFVEEAVLTDYTASLDRKLPAQTSGALVIPLTVDDFLANGLDERCGQTCWQRSSETLAARKDGISGLAVVRDEQISACILYVRRGDGTVADIVRLRSTGGDGEGHLRCLFGRLRGEGMTTVTHRKVHPAEVEEALMSALGFTAVGAHQVYAAVAKQD